MVNLKMVCSYCSCFIELPVALVDYRLKGCELRLRHVCQVEYVAIHEINLDGAELNICRDFFDELWMGGKPEILKKVKHSNMYRKDESGEDEEVLEGAVLGNGGEDVSIVPNVYHRGPVIVSSLGSFSSVGSSYKLYHPSLPFSVRAHHIQEYFNNKRGRKLKFINPHQEKAKHEERMKQGKVIFREKLVVGYWYLIPMESGAELLALKDKATVTVAEERWAAKKPRNY